MSQSSHSVYIIGAARTPTARIHTSLSSIKATNLGAVAIKEALSRSGVSADSISDVYMGQVLQAGAGQTPAKQAAIKAGLPLTIEATTINKVCASGLKAITMATQNIQLGHATAQVAGGMESMSQVPAYYRKPDPTSSTSSRIPGTQQQQQLPSDGLLDGLRCPFNGHLMGYYADQIAQRFGISREDQDKYALESYHRAIRAHAAGIYKDEIIRVPLNPRKTQLVTEDFIQEADKFTPEALAQLSPAFSEKGTVTAGNASFLGDGASAVVLVNDDLARKYTRGDEGNGPKIMAEIMAYADVSATPAEFALAPAKAIRIALERANLSVHDISLWEINEAFAVVVTLELRLDPKLVNINGGAISFGHPLGSSGCRILISLFYQLQPGQYGVAAICNGGGGSTAMIIKRINSEDFQCVGSTI
ncbi:hypothetical protein PENVUL_c016G00406 [Penicillium vulpinum]|uniref:Thiolase N-terminal domain-containing protein n=1 Tax=Penicillium vulpinum TaxID=29845 RepID=A0A1V6RZI3_9EURO|nr:hypothetical protein PENVUL_c016G00406 [Penicillium vulpinum]